ncbi:MAG: DUF4143 domain-containing protein [Pseudomonadota bacterium]
MFNRFLNLKQIIERKSLFLFGPRLSGKTTYLKSHFPDAFVINLLSNKVYAPLAANPSLLTEMVAGNNKSNIIIIDEIQKIPPLLDEVHNLIEENKKLRFILTGSSSRRLKIAGTNLLGGRASLVHFYPIIYPELKTDKNVSMTWKDIISIGALPSILNSKNPFDDLDDYLGLYLKEEIQQEGLVRRLPTFQKFLTFAATMVGQQVNFSSVASDAQLSSQTIQNYFQILADTLVGTLVETFKNTHKRKAMTIPKFYFFDNGIGNRLLGRGKVSLTAPEAGPLLEQFIFNELRAFLDYNRTGHTLEYWRSTSKVEVDFVIHRKGKVNLAIEVKLTSDPSGKDEEGLLCLEEEIDLERKIIVCQTNIRRKKKNGIEVIPIDDFLNDLWEGKIIS